MATHAAALCEKISAEVQCFRAVRYTIARVTLLATCLRVLFLEHGPQPETMAAVTFRFARGGAAVAPVTTRTTKLLRTVDLKDLPVWMADECAREAVGLAARFIWRKTRRCQFQRFSNAGMTDFATIDDVVSAHTNLMAQDRIVVIGHLRLEAIDLCRPQTDELVFQIIVAFLP